jgi:WD40 repeat protein
MRRLSPYLLMLALAGLLLAACDLRREEEAGSEGPPEEESVGERGFIVFTRADPESADPYPYQHQELWRAKLDGGQQERIQLPEGCLGVGWLEVSPNGEKLVFGCDERGSGLRILDLASSVVQPIEAAKHGGAHWSPDSDRLAYGTKGEFHVYDVESGRDDVISTLQAEEVGGWTPDGRVLLNLIHGPRPAEECPPGEFRQGCTSLALVDPGSRETVTIEDVVGSDIRSQDGTKLLASVFVTKISEDPAHQVYDNLELIDMVTGERRRIAFESGESFGAAWLPDGNSFLVAVMSAGRCSIWQVQIPNLDDRRQITDGCGVVDLSNDGSHYYAVQHREVAQPLGPPKSNLWRVDVGTGSETLLLDDVGQVEVWEPPE